MLKIVCCGVLIFVVAATALADPSTPAAIDRAFGNTIVSTYPDGRQARLWLEAGGGYTAKGRRGDLSEGHWKTKGDKLCLKQARPIAVPFQFCTPIPQGHTAEGWRAKAVTGERIVVTIVTGR